MQEKTDRVRTPAELPLTGLSAAEVLVQREKNGTNKLISGRDPLIENIISVVTEPMFILLVAACGVYFVLKELPEAFTMLGALIFVSGIDVFQNFRSGKAIKALSRITQTSSKVLRDQNICEVQTEELVTLDVILCEEGNIVPADARILSSNDFSVNEALMTGESASVEKFRDDIILQGTQVVRGSCYAEITAVGEKTALSGIGKMVSSAGKEKTPLQMKVARFVKVMSIAGGVAFAFVWAYHSWESGSIIHGLLHGLTMAMSILPEEIPVALSTFMALGAYRLLKHGIIARNPRTVETLGSATVICLDKTGTLTQNLMNVAKVWEWSSGRELDFRKEPIQSEVLEYAMWASEISPFDPMEKSIHHYYGSVYPDDRRTVNFMVREFPLSGSPPVMTHIFWDDADHRYLIGCKGGVEGIVKLCGLNTADSQKISELSDAYAREGLRVLGVARGNYAGAEPPGQMEEIRFDFLGIISFYDPPDPNIPDVIQDFYNAGVHVKMITGDNMETAASIARQTGIKSTRILTGPELANITDQDLPRLAARTHIFARINPESKLRIVNALKQSGEIVAMTGDGVNDAPALKAAHIGISMGKRGTDVAKSAAGLVLAADDLSKMIPAIYIGRRINENLTRAIRYIISIHIPIILLVTLPIMLPWMPAMTFSPIHVIFFELIMGPTCSIIFEKEPAPDHALPLPDPSKNKNLLSSQQLLLTILQGLVVTAGCVSAAWYAYTEGHDDLKTRTYIFTALIFCNILLTLANRSFTDTVLTKLRWKNPWIPGIIFISLCLLFCFLYVPALSTIMELTTLAPREIWILLAVATLSVFWLEPFKYFKKAGK